jgi:hypothetical protein
MAGASSLKLQAGEHRIAVIRRHWWFAVRTLCWLAPVLSLVPLYAIADYGLPGAGLAAYANAVDFGVLVAAGLVLLTWLFRDVAPWLATSWVLTDLRLIERRGIARVRRREAYLRSVRPLDAWQKGIAARLFGYGDLAVEVEGRGSRFTLSWIAQPRELETVLQSLIQDAQDEHRRLRYTGGERIQAALARIFYGGSGEHGTPTIELERITRLMVSVQRRLGGSTILYATRRHPIAFVRGLLVELIAGSLAWLAIWVLQPALPPTALVASGAALVLWLCCLIVDWRTRLYVLTPECVLRLHSRVAFARRDTPVELHAVRDVVACSDPISGRLLNTGSIVLERRGAKPVTLHAVPDPDHLKRLIHAGIEEAEERDRLAKQEHLAGELTDWFEQYHRMQGSPEGAQQSGLT